MTNPVTLIDGYKFSHRQQYGSGIESVYSNFTPRMSRRPEVNHVFFLGLQGFLKKYLTDEFKTKFFDLPADEVCDKYQSRINGYLGPNSIGTDHIRSLHKLGYLPLKFNALPEGTAVPLRVPMFTVENTKPEFFWLTNYIETLLSCVIWPSNTSATTASQYRKLLDKYATLTGSAPEFVPWQGHDFSFRGMMGPEAAQLSAIGHLLFFTGTDTVPAMDYIEDYYGPLPANYLLAGSVAATEHSVASARSTEINGEMDDTEYFEALLDLYPTGIVSAVSDTFDLWNVLTVILPKLKSRIMAREGKLVIRPDSGDPVKIICGDPKAKKGSPEFKGVIELLWNTFGGTKTTTGYKLLDGHIGCIYGDSITIERCEEILKQLEAKGFSSGNMVFGIGSYTYQFVTRDNFGHAMKATHIKKNGVGKNIFKKPKTDDGMKNSAKGRLAVLRDEKGELYLVNEATPEQEADSELKTVWQNGQFTRCETFDKIRERAMKELANV